MKTKYLFYLAIMIGLMSSCGSDDEEPAPEETPLVAKIANENQTVAPFTEVTLDGSQSTGPEGFNYQWIYNGSESINMSSTSDAIVSFTPELNTSYNFTLRLTFNGQFSEASANVTVTGGVTISTSSFESDQLRLKNIESDPSLPDYLITEDFTIPSGKTMIIESGADVTIGIADGAGIIVNGTLSNEGGSLYLNATNTSWKGILVDGGSFFNQQQLIIDKAGGATFDGYSEAAAMMLNASSSVDFQNAQITNTVGDNGIVINDNVTSSLTIQNNQIKDTKIPMKYPVALMGSVGTNFYENYDYIHLVSSGGDVTVGSASGEFTFSNAKFFIDDDFTAGSRMNIGSAEILMAEGTGIVCSDQFVMSSSTISGLDGAPWKGIASTAQVVLNSSTIDGAGNAVHNTGSFMTTEKAAINIASNSASVVLSSSTISNSGGYGVYIGGLNGSNQIQNAVFENSTQHDMNMDIQYASAIKNGNTWSSETPVVLRGGNVQITSTIPELGDNKSYLVEGNVNVISGLMTIEPGASLKFQADKGMSVMTRLDAEGTTEKPIIFDGEAGTSGSWKGIELLNQYRMEYCTITNGGSSAFVGQNPSNIIFGGGSNTLVAPQNNYKFNNNTVTHSAGWGWQVKHLKFDPLEGNDTNTFEDNAEVDSDGDGIPDSGEFPGCELDPNC